MQLDQRVEQFELEQLDELVKDEDLSAERKAEAGAACIGNEGAAGCENNRHG